jgi:3'-5' exoribonuclease
MLTATDAIVIRLSDLVDGQEAVCYAALVKKTRGVNVRNQPYYKCLFQDKRVKVEAPIWNDNRFFPEVESWAEGSAYRVSVRGRMHLTFGMQIDLLAIRPADDGDDGFDFTDLYESSKYPPDWLLERVQTLINLAVDDPFIKQLVESIIREQGGLLKRMPAAANFHHGYTGGLLEHIWSMTRVAKFLADHYARYYPELNPPLNKSVVIAAAILHDIGKLRELEYHPVEAKYTTEGQLIGHVLIGRDMIREAASKIDGFPRETLLLLEHAVLSHHGKKEFGAPILPQTIEALLVSYIDDLDAKMNMVVKGQMTSDPAEAFTAKIWALDNRRFYKGQPIEAPHAGPEVTSEAD